MPEIQIQANCTGKSVNQWFDFGKIYRKQCGLTIMLVGGPVNLPSSSGSKPPFWANHYICSKAEMLAHFGFVPFANLPMVKSADEFITTRPDH
jgi:hypothetical protein